MNAWQITDMSRGCAQVLDTIEAGWGDVPTSSDQLAEHIAGTGSPMISCGATWHEPGLFSTSLGADPFGFGEEVRVYDPRDWPRDATTWPTTGMRHLAVQVATQVRIRSYGFFHEGP
jgi:hypothetical protein